MNMRSSVLDTLPPRVRRSLAKFGADLAVARKKRRLTTQMMAERLQSSGRGHPCASSPEQRKPSELDARKPGPVELQRSPAHRTSPPLAVSLPARSTLS